MYKAFLLLLGLHRYGSVACHHFLALSFPFNFQIVLIASAYLGIVYSSLAFISLGSRFRVHFYSLLSGFISLFTLRIFLVLLRVVFLFVLVTSIRLSHSFFCFVFRLTVWPSLIEPRYERIQIQNKTYETFIPCVPFILCYETKQI